MKISIPYLWLPITWYYAVAIIGIFLLIIFLINPKHFLYPAWQIKSEKVKSLFGFLVFLKNRVCAHIGEILLIILMLLLGFAEYFLDFTWP